MEFNAISIKNFISDLPRILNENFKLIKSIFDNVFDSDNPDAATHTISAKGIKVLGKVETNTLSANNILLNVNGKQISLLDLIKRVEDLENANKTNS